MLIRHLAIENFRGIKSLDWHLDSSLICLIGPGDSTKTTILDAIELALLPRWNAPFCDTDFFRVETGNPIKIQITVGQLSTDILSESKCGLFLRGYKRHQPLRDDPDDDCEPVVTIQLRVCDDLEPHWELVKNAVAETKPLSWKDRERFCMARLGNELDRHLTWTRGSALARITEGATDTTSVLAAVHRAANQAVFSSDNEALNKAASRAKDAAVKFGVALPNLQAGLDTRSQGFGTGALVLHDDSRIPIRSIGLGSRRLAALAIQHEGLGASSILLIDEIEYGLEPHRIRRLIKRLCEDRLPKQNDSEVDRGQVIMTTHSPTPIMSLDVRSLRFVRSKQGVTTVCQVDAARVKETQPIARSTSHAFLAKKILVCEGKTEEAMLRGLDDYWETSHGGRSFATCGVVAVNGQGRCSGPTTCLELKRLGFDVAYFGDSDEPLSVSEAELAKEGIGVFLWPDNMATEERACTDMTIAALERFLEIAVDRYTEATVREALKEPLGKVVPNGHCRVQSLIDDGYSEAAVRRAIGKAAKSKKGEWFKDITTGEQLGNVIALQLGEITSTPLATTLAQLEAWVYVE